MQIHTCAQFNTHTYTHATMQFHRRLSMVLAQHPMEAWLALHASALNRTAAQRQVRLFYKLFCAICVSNPHPSVANVTHTQAHTRTHTHILAHTHTHTHTHKHTHAHTHIYRHTHIQTHTHIHTRTHIYKQQSD